MAARHRSRQRALQVLYQWDMTKRPVDEAIRAFYDTLDADKIAEESMEDEPTTKRMTRKRQPRAATRSWKSWPTARPKWRPISTIASPQKSANWKLERMPIVDRNILRLGIYEMSRQDTPAAVVIDEALELARQFSGEESVAFINGVLDAVHKEIETEIGSQNIRKHEHPDGGLRSHALRKNRWTGRCFRRASRGARRTRRTGGRGAPRVSRKSLSAAARAKLIAVCGFRSAPATWSTFSKPHRASRRPRVTYYFVQCPALYDRDGIYGAAAGDFPDNHLRLGMPVVNDAT